MRQFELTLENKDTDMFSFDVTVGGRSMNCVFTWPTEIQTQYDALLEKIDADMQADPLVSTSDINRDYDLLDYYVNQVPSTESEIIPWWQSQIYKPQSLRNISDLQAYTILIERKETYTSAKTVVDLWQEQLCWCCKITDGSSTTVANVIPGGWWRNQDISWAFRFVCEKDTIAKNYLDRVTMVWEVYDED